MKYAKNILEEELKNKVAVDFFGKFDHTEIKGKIDFAVKPKNPNPNIFGEEYFLWAEAKAATTDIQVMLTQLVLTIGKAKTIEKYPPPHYLGCFDREKLALVPYYELQTIFTQTDFNWNVTPSNHESKEFKLVLNRIKAIMNGKDTYIFKFDKDERAIKTFIGKNFITLKAGTSKLQINKNNFMWVYIRWVEEVKPSINVNWDMAKKSGIIDGDFYLADLLSEGNKTLLEKLHVLLKTDYYELDRELDTSGFLNTKRADFNDKQKQHSQFWDKYERPPKEEFWDYIIERHDLLVPPDIRERKGSFYTPRIWVERSQKYIADVLGKDWQDEYYVWDCAAGTGNLLAGLTNKKNLWASDIDKTNVDIMKTMGMLFENQVFQFDFLNDAFQPKSKVGKVPDELFEIITNKKERRKLVIYINPPYAEDTSKTAITQTGKNKRNVAINMVHDKYATLLKKANHELFAQFLIRIYKELQRCKIANFAKLKALCASNFVDFRQNFQAKLESLFVVPANTFDNVNGQFPIGFHIWDTDKLALFEKITADVFDANGVFILKKGFYAYHNEHYINQWIKKYNDNTTTVVISKLCYVGNDFQHNLNMQICSPAKEIISHEVVFNITKDNLIVASVFFAVRQCIPANWLNDRDQFLHPNDGWVKDLDFQSDCLAYTIFHGQNNISSKLGVNHWIPFTEKEINARESFESHFMISFISGKVIQNRYSNLFEQNTDKKCIKRKFSPEAKNVFDAGRMLWKYYHKQPHCNINASLYDIRAHFQGRNEKGKMNNSSEDETYNELIGALREKLKVLAKKIEPKVYEYGFLKK